MAATGYTPISLFYSTTASAVPLAANLVNGELAINLTDGKLYYKDNTGTVKVIAGAGGAGIAGGSNTQVQYNSSGSLAGSANMTFDGTSLTLGGNPTLSAGTANGVLYLNGSKVATSGTGLVFDGTNLGLGVTPSAWGSGFKAFQLGTVGNLSSYNNAGLNVGVNWYYDSGLTPRYITTAGASYYGQGAGAHQWFTAPSGTAGNAITFTQAMTLDASARLSVNTTATVAGCNLNVAGGINSANGALNVSGNGGFYNSSNKFGVDNNGGVTRFYSSGPNSSTRGSYDFHITDSVGSLDTIAATIDSSGNLLVGQTSQVQAALGFSVIGSGAGQGVVSCGIAASTNAQTTWNTYSTTASAYRFYVDMGGTVHATSTTITAISDERLKENVRDLDVGLAEIMVIKPRRFDWKEGKGLDKKNDVGFIAQEFETVFPNSVTNSLAGGDGIEYKAVSQSELIPTLVKAIQEQQAIITDLKSRIEVLEAK